MAAVHGGDVRAEDVWLEFDFFPVYVALEMIIIYFIWG